MNKNLCRSAAVLFSLGAVTPAAAADVTAQIQELQNQVRELQRQLEGPPP